MNTSLLNNIVREQIISSMSQFNVIGHISSGLVIRSLITAASKQIPIPQTPYIPLKTRRYSDYFHRALATGKGKFVHSALS